MKRIVWSELSAAERHAALARPPRGTNPSVLDTVRAVFDAVRAEGDAAVRRLALEFDGAEPEVVAITRALAARERAKLGAQDLAALELARDNIALFHERTRPRETTVEVAPGVTCRRAWRAIPRVGLYVPGGSAPLFSSLLMQALPARAAGVGEIVVVTPPGATDLARALMIVAADLCGLSELHIVGGAQAVAALALGTESIAKVDKIFGPGGAYVAAAKTYAASLAGGPAIDLPAGPSELLVIADPTADPAVVAADLLSQAEHDADAQVILVALSRTVADAVGRAVEAQLATLPRAAIARASLRNARAVLVDDLDAAIEAADAYAPEHLSLNIADAGAAAERISNAGAVFVGAFSAETFGDYVCGPSHVLPTDGAARAWGGITTEAFMRPISIQELTAEGAGRLADAAARLARLEGLEAHARAADIRVRKEAAE
jgi:histidinol dehydrogenase